MSVFTSDLSVSDFALCHRLSLQPISQVLGTSIYQVGYQDSGQPSGGGAGITELHVLSQAWNEARNLALVRMREEADRAGASAVVGVDKIDSGAIELLGSDGTAIQYAATGTAVLREGGPAGPPVLTELSVADYSKLVEAGVEPAGIVAHTSVFFVTWLTGSIRGRSLSAAPRRSFEQRRLTRCFHTARERVMREVGRQATDLEASGVVGIRIEHGTHSHTFTKPGGNGVSGVMITINAIGTAIREISAGGCGPPATRDARADAKRHPRPAATRSLRVKTTVNLLG